MTREEAIQYLDGMKIVIPICNELKELTDERNDALDMAIEALQTDLVRCKDCKMIDGNGWCDFIKGYVHDGYCAWGERAEDVKSNQHPFSTLEAPLIKHEELQQIADIRKTVEEVGRPHGEWIKRGTKITCSNCKSGWSTSFDTIIAGMKYCPMCGADMRGDNNE